MSPEERHNEVIADNSAATIYQQTHQPWRLWYSKQ